MDNMKSLDQYIATIPEPRQIRQRLSQNIAEGKLLRRLLKIAQDKSQTGNGFQEAANAS